MRRATGYLFSFLAFMSLLALACNLSSENAPPTLVPNLPAVTPRATLGYATPSSEQLPQVTPGEQVRIEAELYNLLQQVQSDRLMMHIDALQSFHTRHVNSSQTDPNRGIGAAYNYIMGQFEAIQAQAAANFIVTYQEFDTYFNSIQTVQRNPIAYIQGTEQEAKTIIIGAHYDSRTWDLNDATSYAPGADDNGSGVAAVLELARILSQRPQRTSVMFVLFASEEVNRQGSKAFVAQYLRPNNIDIIGMINLDTIGSYNTSDGTIHDAEIRLFSDGDATNQSGSRHLARTIRFIAENQEAVGLRVNLIPASDRDGRYGDHFSFAEAGYPAVRFIEAVEDAPNREGADTIEQIEPAYLVKTTQTVLAVVVALSEGPRPPRDTVLREAGSAPDGRPMYNLVWSHVPGAAGYIVALRRPGSLVYDQQFSVVENESGAWERYGEYDGIAVAAVDANGMIGPLSEEITVRR
ncbi:MAG: M20/M25/M40 family metallo-hydrolase [bacterium]|nr:M20/M25/M40 family metallo-hydrolase [bacterium]